MEEGIENAEGGDGDGDNEVAGGDHGNPNSNPLFDLLRNDQELTEEALLEAVLAAVRQNPLWLRQRNADGCLPIHLAINTSPPDVVRALIEGWPDSVRERTDDYRRQLPIHLACSHCSRRDTATAAWQVVRLAFEAWPESLMERDREGRLPLHCALLAWLPSTPISVVKFLASRCSQALREKDDKGYLPLHHAVGRAGIETVKYIVKMYPMAVRAKAKDSAFPLFLAAQRFSHPGLDLNFLAEEWPEGLYEPATEGRLPLQEAVRVNNERAVAFILQRWPDLARQWSAEDDRRLALHEAAGAGHLRISQLLVRAWPQSVREASSRDGMLPLHEACRACEEDGVVRYLVEQWRGAVRSKTIRGWLPVHFAVRFRSELIDSAGPALAAAQLLIREFPESVWEATASEGFLPLHIAAGTGCGRPYGYRFQDSLPTHPTAVWTALELIEFLVHQAPASVRRFSNDGMLPVHCAVDSGSSLPAAQFLLSEHERESADEEWPVTSNGRSVLHLAVSREAPRWELVVDLVEQRPALLRQADRDGMLPVHDAAQRNPPLKILQHLVERDPRSLGCANRAGLLPLHVCLGQAAPPMDKVRYLVEQHREALDVADASGSLPLHIALRRGGAVSLDLVALLVERHCPRSGTGTGGACCPCTSPRWAARRARCCSSSRPSFPRPSARPHERLELGPPSASGCCHASRSAAARGVAAGSSLTRRRGRNGAMIRW